MVTYDLLKQKHLLFPFWIVTALCVLNIGSIACMCLIYRKLSVRWIAHHETGHWKLVAQQLMDLQSNLLTLMGELPTQRNATDIEQAARNIVKTYLNSAMELFNQNVSRAAVFLPDEQDPDHISTWEHEGLPDHSAKSARFYIGDDENRRRGVAGCAFVTNSLVICHLTPGENVVIADHPQYIQPAKHLRYRTILAIPIPEASGKENQACGVLCFDSMIEDAFDNSILPLMALLGSNITTIIKTSKSIENMVKSVPSMEHTIQDSDESSNRTTNAD